MPVTGQIPAIIEATKRLAGFKRCPAPTIFYTGREDENIQVISCITGGKEERRVCVIYGLGGVGKTQLALNVIERTWDEWDYVIYTDASSNEAVEKSLKDFAEARDIGQSHTDTINWLESCGERWLIVFDNADTQSTKVRQYIPARGRGGSVLITTRLPDLARLAVGLGSVCHLSSMSPVDAVTLIVKIACSGNQCILDQEREAAEELVQEFGYLALAIVHAGAFIAHSPSMTIVKYRSLFLSQRQRMLDEYKELPEIAKLDERGDTVYTTWRMCYEQLKPESRELLWLIAYLHYNGISEEIFKRAAHNMHSKEYPLPPTDREIQARDRAQKYLSHFINSDRSWNTIKFSRVTADLTSYSLIDFDHSNQTYGVHVLVHDWAKTVVPHTRELAVECTAMVLSLSIDREQDMGSLAFKRQLGLHVSSLLICNPNLGANHGGYFHEVYWHTSQWIQCEILGKKLVEVFQRELGINEIQTWSAVLKLALTYGVMGRWDKALDLQTQTADAGQRITGEEHWLTLTSMSNLAFTYSNLGRYKEAEQLKVQVLDLQMRLLGEEHPLTLTSMNDLAFTYSNLGRYNEAEKLHVQVLDLRGRVLGEEHSDTLASMSHLASVYSVLGRHTKAEQLKLQVLDIQGRILGDEHLSTLSCMGSLASTYSDLGRHKEAEQLQVRVLHKQKRVLGEEHPRTLMSTINLAWTYSGLGRHKEAEQLQVQVLHIQRRVLGEEHPDTLISMGNLAFTYSRLCQYNKAEQLKVQVLDIQRRILGDEHPSTLRCMGSLAETYSDLGRHNEAEQLQVQVLDIRRRILGEEHPDTLMSMNALATTYLDLGQWDRAEEMYYKAISIAERTLGNQHPDTQLYRQNLKSMQSGTESDMEGIQRVTRNSKRLLNQSQNPPNHPVF
ncbi:unnamed protein product [Rhizoctonia solani]|uniref:NB-ARC domain-containing protein n=1 Tax=Rhizoctonia solani TaxID=456999 RepID=A0A8H3E133_9AGAM|nr:unnamed protein product [Rhizoctonia solani]